MIQWKWWNFWCHKLSSETVRCLRGTSSFTLSWTPTISSSGCFLWDFFPSLSCSWISSTLTVPDSRIPFALHWPQSPYYFRFNISIPSQGKAHVLKPPPCFEVWGRAEHAPWVVIYLMKPPWHLPVEEEMVGSKSFPQISICFSMAILLLSPGDQIHLSKLTVLSKLHKSLLQKVCAFIPNWKKLKLKHGESWWLSRTMAVHGHDRRFGKNIFLLQTLCIWLNSLLNMLLQISTQFSGKLGTGRTLCTERNANVTIITTSDNNHHFLLPIVH